MSNLEKLIKEDYTTLDSLRALYVSGTNNLWATIKSGNELGRIKKEALKDGEITTKENDDIKEAEANFYYNMGALANDLLDFLKITGIMQLFIDGRNASKNIYEFSDGLNGDEDEPRPHFDMAQFIGAIADSSAVIERTAGLPVVEAYRLAAPIERLFGIVSDVLGIVNNAITDKNGDSQIIIYLDGGEQNVDLSEVDIDFSEIEDVTKEHLLLLATDVLGMNLSPAGVIISITQLAIDPWTEKRVENLPFIGDEKNIIKADSYHGDQKDNIAYGLGGNDYLSGHEGKDYLNGGSGDDVLDGGEDDDILVDESGNDTYIFNGNFGHDTIYDVDGEGEIKINGVVLTVGEKINNKLWKSADGQYIALLEDFDGVATTQKVVISKENDNNSITIKYWQEGYLGLILNGAVSSNDDMENTTGIGNFNNEKERFTTSQYLWSSWETVNGIEQHINRSANTDLSKELLFIKTMTGYDRVDISDDHNYFISMGLITYGNNYKGINHVLTGNGNNIIQGAIGTDTIFTGSGNDEILVDDDIIYRLSDEQLQLNLTAYPTDKSAAWEKQLYNGITLDADLLWSNLIAKAALPKLNIE